MHLRVVPLIRHGFAMPPSPLRGEGLSQLLLPRSSSGGSGGAVAAIGAAATAAGAVGATLPVRLAGLVLSPLLLRRLLPGLPIALLGAAGRAAAELGLFALAGRLLAGRPLVLTLSLIHI